MGVDFSAILDVSLDWSRLAKARADLDQLTPKLSRIWHESATRQRSWLLQLRGWDYYVAGVPRHDEDESLASRLHPGLEGPMHFLVVPHDGYTTIGHSARWKFFLSETSGVRDRLRTSCKLIAGALGAKEIIYVPDLALEDIAEHRLYDERYERVAAHFRGAWGNASSFENIYPIGERYWERYFIEPVESVSASVEF